ncbi:exopolysaccharide biosynthesis polyprenyl glycosylphosphotransferase (plasmid) [Kribbella sp. CWNU-51]
MLVLTGAAKPARRGRLRWLWGVLALVGLLAVSSRWLAPAVLAYFGADISTRDQLSSPLGLAVGLVSLVVAIVVPIIQARQGRHLAEISDGTALAARPGMNSLDPPDTSMAGDVHGRAELIEALVDLYSWRNRGGPRVRIICGMPGSGKTAIALRVADEVKQQGVRVWWISAAEETELQTGLRQLAQLLAPELGVTTRDLDRRWADDAPDALWRLLNGYRGSQWMLIIDNADDVHVLAPEHELPAGKRGWIRPVTSAKGALLITSRDRRRQVWGDWCHREEIEKLPPAVGAQVLLDIAGESAGSPSDAKALSVRLGGLPLALTLVGRHLADANSVPLPGGITTFVGYRAALDAEPLANAEARGIINSAYELSITQLETRGHGNARPLLRLLSMFADAPIPYTAILDPRAITACSLFSEIGVEELRALLQALAGQSLLELASESVGLLSAAQVAGTLRLHPLLRDANLHAATIDRQEVPLLVLAALLLERATNSPGIDPAIESGWPTWRALTPHTMHLLVSSAECGEPIRETVRHAAVSALRASEYLAATGLAAAALAQARAVEQISTAQLGSDDPTVLMARARVARWLGQSGDLAGARDLFTQLLPAQERTLGSEHPETLSASAGLAMFTGWAGDPAAARDLFIQLLPAQERALGSEHPDTLSVRAGLALFTGRAGDPAGARDLLRHLLPVQERVLGEDHAETMRTLANLATLLPPSAETQPAARPSIVSPQQTGQPHLFLVPPVSRPAPFDSSGWEKKYRNAALSGDFLAATAALCVPLLVGLGDRQGVGSLIFGCLLPLFWVSAIGIARGYESRYLGEGAYETRSILLAGVALIGILAAVAYSARTDLAHGFIELSIPSAVLLSALVRATLRRRLIRRRYRGECMRRVLVVGRGRAASNLRRHLEERPADGFSVVATLGTRGDGASQPQSDESGVVNGALDETAIETAVDRYGIDLVVIVADPSLAGQSLRRVSWALDQRGIDLMVSPGIVEVSRPRISIHPVAGLSLFRLERPSSSSGPHLLKSVFDRVVAALMILVLSPLLLGVVISIRLSSRGPVLFRQTRVGRGGGEFTMFRFRTMFRDAGQRASELRALTEGNNVLFKIREDPRVTPLGKYLRRFSVDELPQLLNVLRGEMSLVGPRPPLPTEVAMYAADDTRRMLVKPGLTGLWQVSGRSDLTWEESVRLDLRYVDNWSIVLDLLILWKTFRAVIGRDGAY